MKIKMKINKSLGQEAVEFVILASLIFIASLAIIFAFKDKIASFFNNNGSITSSSSSKSAIISADKEPIYKLTSNAPVKISGYEVIINDDGSASFTVNDQKVNIPAEAVSLQNEVMQTTGSSGLEYLVKEVANMITKHASEYPNGAVPVNITYGKTTNTATNNNTVYTGTAAANVTQIKVNNDFVMIQKNQNCKSSLANSCLLDMNNVYRMEGTISNGTFKNITSSIYNNNNFGYKATYSGSIDKNNKFSGTLEADYGGELRESNFLMDFSNIKNSFSL